VCHLIGQFCALLFHILCGFQFLHVMNLTAFSCMINTNLISISAAHQVRVRLSYVTFMSFTILKEEKLSLARYLRSLVQAVQIFLSYAILLSSFTCLS
jgi:hypothetical protein